MSSDDSPLPDVDVVIPARNEAANIASAVNSVRDQAYAGTIRILVGLAPSTDATAKVLSELALGHDDLITVPNPSGRTAGGLNAAIRSGSAPVVVRLDGHAVLPTTYVRDAVEVLRSTGAANVGGRQIPAGQTAFEGAVAEAMTSRFGTGGSRFHVGGAASEVDTVYLGVFDRGALERVGGFDERLIRNQDYELNIRLRKGGGRIWFDPRLGVVYRPRSDLRSLAWQYFEYGMWKSVVGRIHPGSLRLRQIIPTLATLGIVVSAVVGMNRPRWLIVPGVYALTAAAASWRSAHRRTLFAVYPTMHLSWGAGFLAGLVRLRGVGQASGESPVGPSVKRSPDSGHCHV